MVRGTVRDTSRNILPEVRVAAAGGKAETDERGEFVLHLAARPTGTINFEKPGYGERHLPLPAANEPMEVSLQPNQNNQGLIVERARLSPSHSLMTVKQLEPALLRQPLTASVYREFVKRHGEAAPEEVIVRLYFPAPAGRLEGALLISEHGMGGSMMEARVFRDFADRHHFALVGVLGEAIQRGIFPAETLDSLLEELGAKSGHPELGAVPVITFGHSNGTGFSDLYAALQPERVIGWISYHCGGSWQLTLPGLERAPGLVLVGQKDALFTDQDEIVRGLRHDRRAAVGLLVEGEAAHWPADRAKMNALLVAYCEACLRVRAPAGLAAGRPLASIDIEHGWLGGEYDRKRAGLQAPPIAPFGKYSGDRSRASWLPDETFARIWQHFMGTADLP